MQEISLSTKQKHKTDEEHEEIFKKFIELLSNIFFFTAIHDKKEKKGFYILFMQSCNGNKFSQNNTYPCSMCYAL